MILITLIFNLIEVDTEPHDFNATQISCIMPVYSFKFYSSVTVLLKIQYPNNDARALPNF